MTIIKKLLTVLGCALVLAFYFLVFAAYFFC